jgi:hypothetical protein
MNGSSSFSGPNNNHDDLIRRLVSLLEDGSDNQTDRPSEEALEAFLSGTATAEQETVVLEALERSRLYRKEVAEIASDLENLQNQARTASQSDDVQELPEAIRKHIDELPTGKIYRLRGFTPLLAAAILIVTAVALLVPTGKEFNLVTQALERNTLISIHSRGSLQESPMIYATAQEAALAAFRAALTYENAAFAPRVLDSEVPPQAAGPTYSASIGYSYTATRYFYQARLPGPTGAVEAAEFYLLALPSRNLYKLPAAQESVAVDWKGGRTEYICLTLVYPVQDGFSFTQAKVYSTK